MQTSVVIKGLEIQASVGIYDYEKLNTQCIVFDLEINTNLPKPSEDDIKHALSYEDILNQIKYISTSKHYELLETIAFEVIDAIGKDKRIVGGFIEISKPDIFKDTNSVGVRVDF